MEEQRLGVSLASNTNPLITFHSYRTNLPPPQGLFTNFSDLWSWFAALTDFFAVVVTAAATVSLQLDFELSV